MFGSLLWRWGVEAERGGGRGHVLVNVDFCDCVQVDKVDNGLFTNMATRR